MGLAHSPQVVTNGLVFAYDMTNTSKSWKGAPVTNLFGTIDNGNIRSPNTVHFWNGYEWLTTGGYTHPGVAGPAGTYLGKVYKFTSGALSSTWSGNSYGYMLKSMTLTASQYYAMSCWSYVSADCNIDAMPASIEGASSTAGITGYNSSYAMGSKGNWQRIAMSCVASAGSMNFIPVYPQRYGVTDGSFAGFFMYAMPQVETNTYPSPGIETSRSSSQAIVDLVGQNTVTANGLTYNSDGTISFLNNSGFSIPSINFADAQTIEIWLKPLEADGNRRNPYNQAYAGYGTWTHEPNGTINYYYGDGGGDNSPYVGHTSSFTVAQNEIACVCTTRDLTTSWWYKNGVQYNSYPHSYGSLTATPGNITIGNGYAGAYYGNIYAVKLYNRALSAAEVKQNFNALRGRYGI